MTKPTPHQTQLTLRSNVVYGYQGRCRGDRGLGRALAWGAGGLGGGRGYRWGCAPSCGWGESGLAHHGILQEAPHVLGCGQVQGGLAFLWGGKGERGSEMVVMSAWCGAVVWCGAV